MIGESGNLAEEVGLGGTEMRWALVNEHGVKGHRRVASVKLRWGRLARGWMSTSHAATGIDPALSANSAGIGRLRDLHFPGLAGYGRRRDDG